MLPSVSMLPNEVMNFHSQRANSHVKPTATFGPITF